MTGHCLACNQDPFPGFGADASLNYSVILGYSGTPPDGSTQWIWFEIFGQEGAAVDGVVLANMPGLTQDDFTPVFDDGTGEALVSSQISFGPASGLADFFSNVNVIPEPGSAGILAMGVLGLLGFVRRRR